MRLAQKVALVTSSGPGPCRETAKLFARQGARVVVCGRNAEQGRMTVEQIRQAGGQANFFLTDISLAADVKATVDETIATYGRLDILFNHAGHTHAQDSSVVELSEAVWDRVIEVNLKGTFLCCQYALPFLRQSGSGLVINLVVSEPGQDKRSQSAIAISRGGVLAMTREIANEFAQRNVRANLIWLSPAGADAEFMPGLEQPRSLLAHQVMYLPEALAASPNRFEQAAQAALYLANERSETTGAVVIVGRSNGGG